MNEVLTPDALEVCGGFVDLRETRYRFLMLSSSPPRSSPQQSPCRRRGTSQAFPCCLRPVDKTIPSIARRTATQTVPCPL
eukprot:1773974-Amphidinium_carterae.1